MKSKRKPCYASKGLPKVPGKPKGTDIIPAWLTPGEAVLSPGAAEMLGRGNVQALNKAASTMRLGTPQYKAEGEDQMQPVMELDSATLGNQRADEILSDPGMFDSREVQAAERYMDPAGLAGGPSLARDQAFLGGTRSLESANNPADESLRKQIAQAQQGLFGSNQPRRLGNVGDDGDMSEGMSAAQEAIRSALSYGQKAAQEASQEGMGVAQSAIRDANDRARYMSQGGIVQPGYYGMGTSMVLGNRPMYMAGGGVLDDNRLRQGRDPGVAQAMQSYPVQKPVAPPQTPSPVLQKAADMAARPGPMTSVNQGIDAAKSAWQNTAPQYGTGAGAAMALREGVGTFKQAASERLQNRLQPVGNALQEASNFVGVLAGRNPAQQQPNRVGTGFNPATATTGLANRGSYNADIANATGKPSSSTAPEAPGRMDFNPNTGAVSKSPEYMKFDPKTNSLSWINQQAKDLALQPRLGSSVNAPMQAAANPVYMGGMRMPWNMGDFIGYKDQAGIIRTGRAVPVSDKNPTGFTNSGINIMSLMQQPGMANLMNAQTALYGSNKDMALANDSNAQAAIRPMQGLSYLGNVMRDTSTARAQDSQADINEAVLKNPNAFAGMRLGGASADLVKPQSIDLSEGKIAQIGNQFFQRDMKGNIVKADIPVDRSAEEQAYIDALRNSRPDLAGKPDAEILEMLRGIRAQKQK